MCSKKTKSNEGINIIKKEKIIEKSNDCIEKDGFIFPIKRLRATFPYIKMKGIDMIKYAQNFFMMQKVFYLFLFYDEGPVG